MAHIIYHIYDDFLLELYLFNLPMRFRKNAVFYKLKTPANANHAAGLAEQRDGGRERERDKKNLGSKGRGWVKEIFKSLNIIPR